MLARVAKKILVNDQLTSFFSLELIQPREKRRMKFFWKYFAKAYFVSLVSVLSVGSVSSAHASTFVFDGSGTGAIDAFETAGTAASFYGSNNRAPFPINDNGVNFFFHRDTTTGVLSLGLIVNRNGDG